MQALEACTATQEQLENFKSDMLGLVADFKSEVIVANSQILGAEFAEKLGTLKSEIQETLVTEFEEKLGTVKSDIDATTKETFVSKDGLAETLKKEKRESAKEPAKKKAAGASARKTRPRRCILRGWQRGLHARVVAIGAARIGASLS